MVFTWLLSTVVKVGWLGRCCLGNWSWYNLRASHLFELTWTYFKCISANLSYVKFFVASEKALWTMFNIDPFWKILCLYRTVIILTGFIRNLDTVNQLQPSVLFLLTVNLNLFNIWWWCSRNVSLFQNERYDIRIDGVWHLIVFKRCYFLLFRVKCNTRFHNKYFVLRNASDSLKL